MTRLLVWIAAITMVMGAAATSRSANSSTQPLLVPYMYESPKIDGRVDADVADLPVHELATVGAVPAAASGIKANYRIGYGVDFLFLYIGLSKPTLVFRDRGYQNGDGVVVAITMPDAKGPSKEFYVLGFTPMKDTVASWQDAFIWYHDVDLVMAPLVGAKMASLELGDRIAFEIKIPWSGIYPYHPWLRPQIGFNLQVTGAVGSDDKISFATLPDDKIFSEQSGRKSTVLQFAPPVIGPLRVTSGLWRNNLRLGLSDSAIVVYAGDSATTQDILITISKTFGTFPGLRQLTLTGTGKVETLMVALPTLLLPPVDYRVTWVAGQDSGAYPLTVLKPHEPVVLQKKLETEAGSLSPATKTTLQFLLSEIKIASDKLKPYQPAPIVRRMIQQFDTVITIARTGRDFLATQTGVMRRAFKSAIDKSLQPYSLQVPVQFSRDKTYPLIVYLHGSGEDDQRALPSALFSDSMFVLAPFGRGTSNCYSADHAQQDIMEALADVIANYPIDPTRIVISGFSMGGYGAYRTFAEHPTAFRAAAIFSGHPNLANEWSGSKSEPNYLNAESLAPFAKHPVYVFHGGNDRNCPVDVTQQVVAKLQAAGAEVSFELEPQAGHELPSKETIAKFRTWLAEVLMP
jgi:predicted esterase